MTIQNPKPLGDARRHVRLVQDMARATGVDLVAEARAERLTRAGWADMVERCRGCAWERDGGGCSRWLGMLEEAGIAAVPGTCENAGTFAALRLPQG